MKDNTKLTITANPSYRDYIKDLFRYRELLYFFAWRDILVRYRQAFFGIAWALVRPLLTMIVFVVVFGKLVHLSSGNVKYSLFVLTATLPWQLLSTTATDSCPSIVNQAHLIGRAYFPRMLIPAAQVIVSILDFIITGTVLLVWILFSVGISWQILWFPAAFSLMLILALGIALWLSAMTALYRDFRIIIPFFVQFGMFISPVGYGTFIISEQWRMFYYLNPVVGVVDFFRLSLLGQTYPGIETSILCSTIVSLLIFFSGFYFFRNIERSFADRI